MLSKFPATVSEFVLKLEQYEGGYTSNKALFVVRAYIKGTVLRDLKG